MIRMTMMTRLLQVPAPHRPNSRNKAKQILKAGGSIKENIKKSLPIRSRLLAIKMDGSLITVHPGNEHDSKTFPELYEELKRFDIDTVVMDAGYKIPAIAKLMLDNGQIPLFPYKSPMTKKGFFKKSEYVYDEYYDGYICPQLQMLKYSTTNREGYREYKSDGSVCAGCPDLEKCTNSKNHVKVVTRHIWQEYMDRCEDIRHTRGMKELYGRRKETIERNFGTAKEHHGMRYTQLIGKKKMRMKVGLTFACMNMKKLVRILESRDKMDSLGVSVMRFLSTLFRKSPFIGNLIWT